MPPNKLERNRRARRAEETADGVSGGQPAAKERCDVPEKGDAAGSMGDAGGWWTYTKTGRTVVNLDLMERNEKGTSLFGLPIVQFTFQNANPSTDTT
jgi:hypothetical protein